MCMVSMVSDYGQERIPAYQWTPDTWSDYQEILRLLKKLDEKLGQKDCDESDKQEWMKEIEKRLKSLEVAKLLEK